MIFRGRGVGSRRGCGGADGSEEADNVVVHLGRRTGLSRQENENQRAL
jgi:hypothetical protein